MQIEIHPHARERMRTRGANEGEVQATISEGEQFPAKHGRLGYRRNFSGEFFWRGRRFDAKQLEVYAVLEEEALVMVTVIIMKYFSENHP